MQKLELEHETLVKPKPFGGGESTEVGADHPLVFQLRALPALSTAMQKLVVGHETDANWPEPSIFAGLVQSVPSNSMAWPPASTAMQNVELAHETDTRSAGPGSISDALQVALGG
jgi:hypothetical protein